MTDQLTLDQASDAFCSSSTPSTAYNLMAAARAYWHDGMIGDDEFDCWMVSIQSFLAQANNTLPDGRSLGEEA